MTEQQSQIFEVLKYFSSLCESNGLQYWLVGGTLLGAVRHKGFIPWDDDVDVAMPEEDYRRFLALGEKLPKPWVVQSKNNDEKYPFYFSKLCNTEISFTHQMPNGPKGIYIDIFPFLPSRKPTALVKLAFNAENVISYVLQAKLAWTSGEPYKKWYARVGFKVLNYLSKKQLEALREKIIAWIRKEDTGYWFSAGGVYRADKEFYKAEWFQSSLQVLFEKQPFFAPKGWHDILYRNYGNDYMLLPPKEERKPRHQ